MTIRRRMRVRRKRGGPADEGPGEPSNDYPRLMMRAADLPALRTQITTDPTLNARYQAVLDSFQNAANTAWWTRDDKGGDTFNRTFAAFLTMVRRPTDDLGLNWNGQSWEYFRDRIVNDVLTNTATGTTGWNPDDPNQGVGLALIYDALYNDMSELERAQIFAKIEQVSTGSPMGSPQSGSEAWDNGNSIRHARAILTRLVKPGYISELNDIYTINDNVADSNNWMPMGFGLGREWHDGFPSRHGLMFLLMCMRNAGAFTDAQTLDRMSTHLRDVWMMTRLSTIPGLANDTNPDPYWHSDWFHTQDKVKAFQTGLNVGSHMLWAAVIVPEAISRGNLSLSLADDESNQSAIANSLDDYLGYLWGQFNEPVAAAGTQTMAKILNWERIGVGSATTEHGHGNTFWSFPPWLIYNVQEVTNKTAVQAGIPTVRRWWKGTTDWTMMQSSHDRSTRTACYYVHRRYAASNFEEGTKFNGSWSLHRNGPLLVRRGATGHHYITASGTWAMNGCVTFYDENEYEWFGDAELIVSEGNEDLSGQRNFNPGFGEIRSTILSDASHDYGQVTAWGASDTSVSLTSDLTRSYNSTEVQVGDTPPHNEAKISSFVREFVRIVDDGSGRGKVFTYDRIVLVDTGGGTSKYKPRYSLSPGPPPTIDGTETPYTPWYPGYPGAPTGTWTATGPTRWDYTGATRLIVDHSSYPTGPNSANGKACVTWLQPSSADVRRQGGHNAEVVPGPSIADGDPHFGPWGAWWPTSDYSSNNSDDKRAYVGDSSVYVSHTGAVSLDTRFLIACEDMLVGDTPSTAAEMTCDANSVAARCGTAGVVFAKENTGHTSGEVTVPSGVTHVLLLNLPANTLMTLGGTATVSSAERTTDQAGRLDVVLSAVGTLTFS